MNSSYVLRMVVFFTFSLLLLAVTGTKDTTANTFDGATTTVSTFSYSGSTQTYTLPNTGCSSLQVTVCGAAGGQVNNVSTPGYGTCISAILLVPSTSWSFDVTIGQIGGGNSYGGWNGGGNGGVSGSSYGGGGGGATDFRTSSGNLTTRFLVAAGGGGTGHDGSYAINGGNGGPVGGIGFAGGYDSGYPSSSSIGASGGTQTAGGAAGSSMISGRSGTGNEGSFGIGGNGDNSPFHPNGGGGGGGGWYGGGSGFWTGGGGGSSHVNPMYVGSVTSTLATNTGSGYAIMTCMQLPSSQPSSQPSRQPTHRPSIVNANPKVHIPTGQPSERPSKQPTRQPTTQPSVQPSDQPSMQPTRQPSRFPTVQPSTRPSIFNANPKAHIPSGQPSKQPTSQPSRQPSSRPTVAPTTDTAQQNIITTFAGTGIGGTSGDGGAAVNAQLEYPQGVGVDSSGNVYITDYNHLRIVSSDGIISTYQSRDTASTARYYDAVSVASNGNVYIADFYNHQVYLLTHSSGLFKTFAGTAFGSSGDGGPATSASLKYPSGVAVDSLNNNLYIADSNNNKIRVVNSNGIITTFAGTGSVGSAGDGGAATSALLNYPQAVAVDATGENLYVADTFNYRIRLIVRSTGIITTFAGSVHGYSSGDGGMATNARLGTPYGVAVDTSNNVYIADYGNNNVRLVTKITNIITTFAGTGTKAFSGDGGPATSAQLYSPLGICVDASGNVYIADYENYKIRLVTRRPMPTGPSRNPTYRPTISPYPNITQNYIGCYGDNKNNVRVLSSNLYYYTTGYPWYVGCFMYGQRMGYRYMGLEFWNGGTQVGYDTGDCWLGNDLAMAESQGVSTNCFQVTNTNGNVMWGGGNAVALYDLSLGPTMSPTFKPTGQPTRQPSNRPSIFNANPKALIPTGQPTFQPSSHPTMSSPPTLNSSFYPTMNPTINPTNSPSTKPTTSSPSSIQSTLWRYGGMQCNGDDFLSACYQDQCGGRAGIACWMLYNSGYCPNNWTGCYNNPIFDPTSPDDATLSWNVFDTTNAPTCFKTCNTNYLACKATYGCGNCLYNGLITATLHAGDCNYSGSVASGTWIQRSVPSFSPTTTPSSTSSLSSTTSMTFNCTGTTQTLHVPSNVASVVIDMAGAQGGGSYASSSAGGLGGRVQTTYAVTPSSTLYINVGCQGKQGSGQLKYQPVVIWNVLQNVTDSTAMGGWNGGGTGDAFLDYNSPAAYGDSGGGGGATDIRTDSTLVSRLVVAGAGGGGYSSYSYGHGSGCKSNGGSGGGLTGGSIADRCNYWSCPDCCQYTYASGGTQTAGGVAGFSCWGGTNGALGVGGGYGQGAGGGGGYYGGGGGRVQGGGGGSSYVGAGGSNTIHTQGYNKGNGYAIITLVPSSPSTPQPSLHPTIAPSLRPTIAPTTDTAQQNIITTFAGTGIRGESGDGGAAVKAQLNFPQGVGVDSSGNVYITDYITLRIVSSDGIISIYQSRDTASTARYYNAVSVAANGYVYIADNIYHQIYLLNINSGLCKTFAGNAGGVGSGSGVGSSGDGGPATSATLQHPSGVAVDSLNNNVYIADTYNNKIRVVNSNGIISTYAGTGSYGSTGDGGAATSALLKYPYAVAVDATGENLYIADTNNYRIRLIVRNTGIITTFAGSGFGYFGGDGGMVTNAQLTSPYGVAVDISNNVYIADYANNNVRLVTKTTNIITTFAGTGTYASSGDGGPATSAQFNSPWGICVDISGNVYIADHGNYKIRLVTRRPSVPSVQPVTSTPSVAATIPTANPTNSPSFTQGIIITYAGGGYGGNGIPATSSQLLSPRGIALDQSGRLYIADANDNKIRMVNTAGIITTYAGTGFAGSLGDGGAAISAQLSAPRGVAVDNFGNVYCVDSNNNKIRMVNSAGTITTFAGTGAIGSSGDGGAAAYARLNFPSMGGVAVDLSGNVYIADSNNNKVRMVNSAGIITTYVGTGAVGSLGDGGAAISAQLSLPVRLAVDLSGNLYIADCNNNKIRMVNSAGIITTFAGTGALGTSGDGGAAISAQLYYPWEVAIDTFGNIFIPDHQNNKIRMVNSVGIITTIAGTGMQGSSGDGGAAILAQFNSPIGVAVDGRKIYVADSNNAKIRMFTISQTTTYPNSTGNYIGCFKDAINKVRVLPTNLYYYQTSYLACFQQARAGGYRYVGLESWGVGNQVGTNAGECWAGNSLSSAESQGSAYNCAQEMSSDGIMMWGSYDSIALYDLSLMPTFKPTYRPTMPTTMTYPTPPPTTTYPNITRTYLGCYNDYNFNHVLPNSIYPTGYPWFLGCFVLGQQLGYRYIGLGLWLGPQYGYTCWGGTDLIKAESQGSSTNCAQTNVHNYGMVIWGTSNSIALYDVSMSPSPTLSPTISSRSTSTTISIAIQATQTILGITPTESTNHLFILALIQGVKGTLVSTCLINSAVSLCNSASYCTVSNPVINAVITKRRSLLFTPGVNITYMVKMPNMKINAAFISHTLSAFAASYMTTTLQLDGFPNAIALTPSLVTLTVSTNSSNNSTLTSSSSSKDILNLPALIGGILGGMVALCLLSGMVYYARYRINQAPPPPIQDIHTVDTPPYVPPSPVNLFINLNQNNHYEIFSLDIEDPSFPEEQEETGNHNAGTMASAPIFPRDSHNNPAYML